ncbi:helix-turn-helix transcriptional regulator [Paludisphaera mucosa]|uniref:Helix-turn-helix transcriptional regulator n=1 Tax=Paludisphaera mucosa TaxID=3030827 RepID=A0ABT6F6T3_9BACT|nr:helix-turn-helix transcriptional regulator [Paludisphaera mucosa]MDG3003303.1 helix-turn-helix transcriptional regulator [Paludisphaera mucosa]
MTGEAREFGDDAFAWREHWLRRLAKVTDASMGHFGEMAIGPGYQPRDIGVAVWGYQEGFIDLATVERQLVEFRTEPDFFESLREYFRIQAEEDGVCLGRREFIEDRRWYGSTDHQVVQAVFGVDPVLYCHRSINGAATGEGSGMVLHRARGMRDFGARERAIIREAHDAIVPLIGRTLARFHEPSPADLAPRVRQTLACMLEGDSDKQVASRLGLATYTVNQYAKCIYKHFSVESRAELLARWLRRGWGVRFAWNEPEIRPARAPYTVRNDRVGAGD